MTTIPATFRAVDSEIFNQLEQTIRAISRERQQSALQITAARRKAVRLLRERARRGRLTLEQVAKNELAAALKKQESELIAEHQMTLLRCHQAARELTNKCITEILGGDAKLVAQAALNRLAVLFTNLGEQSGLTVTLSPSDSEDSGVQDYCSRHQIERNIDPFCPPGDLRISLSSGTIDSLLADDIAHLTELFSPQTPEGGVAHG